MVDNTFYSDFSIADKFGIDAIIDTFNRAFEEWKGNYKYLTALVITLNHKIWEHYENGGETDSKACLYNDLWAKADNYACNFLEGEELDYFYRETD